jgi:hypothetical protein
MLPLLQIMMIIMIPAGTRLMMLLMGAMQDCA